MRWWYALSSIRSCRSEAEPAARRSAQVRIGQLACVFGGATVGGVLEIVVEFDLGALQLLAVVEPGPYRRGAHVYGQDTCVLWFSGFHPSAFHKDRLFA